MEETERRFRLLVESVTDYAIYMLDEQGHIVNWNPGAARTKGYSREEALGRHFSMFYTPEDQAADETMRARIRSLHESNPMLGMHVPQHAMRNVPRGAEQTFPTIALFTPYYRR